MNLSATWRKRLYWLTWGLLIIIGLAAAVALWQWYDSGGGFEAVYVAVGVLLAGLWAANRFLARQQTDEPTNKQTYQPLPPDPQPLVQWRQQMNAHFALEELRSLVFDLGITFDNLAGGTLDGKIVSLLEHAQHHNQLLQLHAKLKQLRPHVIWPNPGQQTFAHDDRNRANFLNLVQSSWIDGFLHQSLHREVLKLTLSYQPDAVPQRAWRMVLQQTGQSDQTIPQEQSIREVFERNGRSLLLLGDPGSGKTITMLQLAEELVKLAQDDPNQPMPVVLNLSSWAQEKPPLVEWLVEEIFVQYGVARELGRSWIAQNQLLYLLDGLDEVAADARDGCIAAINAFKAAYPVEMLVCSRIKDYEVLHNRLHLGAAIRIQPLTDAQVDDFLGQPGLEMQAVRAMLKTDPTLRELTQSPLLLNVMVLAYQRKSMTDLQAMTTVEARRQHLIDTYVTAMFHRRSITASHSYSEAEVRHWLTWLASSMGMHQVSVFYVERLQPTWLPIPDLFRRYRQIYGMIFRLTTGLMGGLVGMLYGLMIGVYTEYGGIVGLLGLVSGLYFGRFDWKENESITLIEELTWRLPVYRDLKSVIKSKPKSPFLVLLFAIIYGVLFGPTFGLRFLLILGVSVGLGFGLHVSYQVKETRKRLLPNQGIRSSLSNGCLFGILYGLSYGLLFMLSVGMLVGLIVGYRLGPSVGLRFVILFGLIHGLVSGVNIGLLNFGGEAVVQHYIVRWLMARANMLPYPLRDKKLVDFLDAMVDQILMRRAGGGYLFVHRALLEHFAAQLPYFAGEQEEH
ncbi:NACHT domain-containing protein [Candidatus Leptofilum sp.]|uniref:NACHT domain-containing protein n=1 Tax=Candidatus Leptofilum sp. TaxID=3241576 RepID=UPI003B5B4713